MTLHLTAVATDAHGASAPETFVGAVEAQEVSPFADSFIATTASSDIVRNFGHNNATKSFFHDGTWWAVLPEGEEWKVLRFDGPLPSPAENGGWTITSQSLMDSSWNADIAWDAASETLYVLQYNGDFLSSPYLLRLTYDANSRSFSTEATIQLAGNSGALTGNHWTGNKEIALGLDQHGNPLVACIGGMNGGSSGLYLAYASHDLSEWSQIIIDPEPTSLQDNSKVDIVSFIQDGIQRIGLAYSSDGPTDVWKFAWLDTDPPLTYRRDWNIEVVTAGVSIDNHMAALWDGSRIFMAQKDSMNSVWLTVGLPGMWEQPVKVTDGSIGPSRPSLVLDKTNNQLMIFYQESTSDPYGDIYMKRMATVEAPIFDPNELGLRVIQNYSPRYDLIDPQLPFHPVDASMGGFFVFARSQEVGEIWYSYTDLAIAELYTISDVLLRNVDGSVAKWLMNGASIVGGAIVANPGNDWTFVMAGDFNSDQHADMLFQNADGSLAQWWMNGTSIAASFYLLNPGVQWLAVGGGDFNNDDRADILFRHENGDIAIWQMNGETILSAAVVASPGTAWQVAGTSDFNGDGKSDILFRHEDGRIAQWQMDGTTIADSSTVASLDASMSVIGTGNFNGNDRDAILLQQGDGTVTVWTLDGGVISDMNDVANPGTAWNVAGTGDYNGDGKTDVLLQHTDGSVAQWLMDGSTILSAAVVVNPGVEWHVV